MGDRMGGGWHGCFWGTPILHLFVANCYVFPGLAKHRGAPKTAVPTPAHPIPHLTPSELHAPSSGLFLATDLAISVGLASA